MASSHHVGLLWEAKNILRRLAGRRPLANPRKAPLSADVQTALGLPPASPPGANFDPGLTALVARATARPAAITSRELFSIDGQPLPGWREADVDPNDDWVTAPSYYPIYHQFFQTFAAAVPHPRLLEIGVRTGYVGMCFARAIDGAGEYIGVDPNLYLPNSLDLARASFAALQRRWPGFRFHCLLGYSDNRGIQRRLRRFGPYDLIHVDGDHTVRGKLIDLDLCRSLVKPEGIVLVDDYHHLPHVVQDAVARALQLGWYSRFALLNTKRGMALLRK